MLLFADDLELISDSSEQIQRYLDKLAEFADLNRLVVNVEKTKHM